jgi:hypothetical protein
MCICNHVSGYTIHRLAQAGHTRPHSQGPQLFQHAPEQRLPAKFHAGLVLSHAQAPASGQHPTFRIHRRQPPSRSNIRMIDSMPR